MFGFALNFFAAMLNVFLGVTYGFSALTVGAIVFSLTIAVVFLLLDA